MGRGRNRSNHRTRGLFGAAGRFVRRWRLSAASLAVILLSGVLFFSPWGCTPNAEMNGELPPADRVIRVNIVPGVDQVAIRASEPPAYFTSLDGATRALGLPRNTTVSLALTSDGWRIGGTLVGRGELVIRPATIGSVSIENVNYRGQFRFVPTGGGRFDVVNDLDLDDYLAGVLARELLSGWLPNTYSAQAVVARTYALYEKKSSSAARHFDVWATTASQVYGGIPAESSKSREAASNTAGLVVAYGPAGREKIFKAYFSSCCGGISQSVHDAFGEPLIEPLTEQNAGTLCSASPKFNWGPIVVGKEDLSRRFRSWGQHRLNPMQNIGTIRSVEIADRNRFGRPVRFNVYDSRGLRYTLKAEELRWAVNTDASDGTKLYSSFVENIINEPDRVRFVGGHGSGHGVGMCQWCAEARARAGMSYEDIVLAAYPGAKLVRAY
ncbi:MAG: SpoIID/LytB domain-containing protein [Tepidisphaeraceae bacterium]